MSGSAHVDQIRRTFETRIAPAFLARQGVRRVLEGPFGVDHYVAWLREIVHQTRSSPRVQALAVADLKALGLAADEVGLALPLPETVALVGFASHMLEHVDPVGYLGYCVFMLELPAQHGPRFVRRFVDIGLPPDAVSFFRRQPDVEVELARQVRRWLAQLVQTDEQQARICHVMQTTAELYARMVEAAIARVDAVAMQQS